MPSADDARRAAHGCRHDLVVNDDNAQILALNQLFENYGVAHGVRLFKRSLQRFGGADIDAHTRALFPARGLNHDPPVARQEAEVGVKRLRGLLFRDVQPGFGQDVARNAFVVTAA